MIYTQTDVILVTFLYTTLSMILLNLTMRAPHSFTWDLTFHNCAFCNIFCTKPKSRNMFPSENHSRCYVYLAVDRLSRR